MKNPNKKYIAGYIRVASEEGSDEKMKLQKEVITEIIKTRRLLGPITLYTNIGSGLETHSGLKGLMQDAEGGYLSAVVVSSPDRISRNTIKLKEIREDLGRLGIPLYTPRGDISEPTF